MQFRQTPLKAMQSIRRTPSNAFRLFCHEEAQSRGTLRRTIALTLLAPNYSYVYEGG